MFDFKIQFVFCTVFQRAEVGLVLVSHLYHFFLFNFKFFSDAEWQKGSLQKWLNNKAL